MSNMTRPYSGYPNFPNPAHSRGNNRLGNSLHENFGLKMESLGGKFGGRIQNGTLVSYSNGELISRTTIAAEKVKFEEKMNKARSIRNTLAIVAISSLFVGAVAGLAVAALTAGSPMMWVAFGVGLAVAAIFASLSYYQHGKAQNAEHESKQVDNLAQRIMFQKAFQPKLISERSQFPKSGYSHVEEVGSSRLQESNSNGSCWQEMSMKGSPSESYVNSLGDDDSIVDHSSINF